MGKDYTREAQMAAEAYVKAHPHFHGPTYSLDGDVNFSLSEAANLIAQSRIDRQRTLQRIAAQEQSQEELAQAREDVSLLPDREAEKVRHEWIKDAEASARSYASARNRHSQPRSTQDVHPDLYRSTLSWIEKQRGRNWCHKKAK